MFFIPFPKSFLRDKLGTHILGRDLNREWCSLVSDSRGWIWFKSRHTPLFPTKVNPAISMSEIRYRYICKKRQVAELSCCKYSCLWRIVKLICIFFHVLKSEDKFRNIWKDCFVFSSIKSLLFFSENQTSKTLP